MRLKIKLQNGKTRTIFLADQENFLSSLLPSTKHFFTVAYYHKIIIKKTKEEDEGRRRRRRQGKMKCAFTAAVLDHENEIKQNHRWLLTIYDKRDFNRIVYAKGLLLSRSHNTFSHIVRVEQPQNFLFRLTLFRVFFFPYSVTFDFNYPFSHLPFIRAERTKAYTWHNLPDTGAHKPWDLVNEKYLNDRLVQFLIILILIKVIIFILIYIFVQGNQGHAFAVNALLLPWNLIDRLISNNLWYVLYLRRNQYYVGINHSIAEVSISDPPNRWLIPSSFRGIVKIIWIW